jgi:NhaP-type Na+/H+ or K+/H+ antiporter
MRAEPTRPSRVALAGSRWRDARSARQPRRYSVLDLLQGIAIVCIGVSVCIQGWILRRMLRREGISRSREVHHRRRPGSER